MTEQHRCLALRLPALRVFANSCLQKTGRIRRRRSLLKNKGFPVAASKEKKKKKRRTALVLCVDRKQFWTTQTQFWQWVREGIVVKSHDNPLTGSFVRDHEETAVVISNTVLNLAYPNHLREALLSRRMGLLRK
jgi:hypothetical protein